VTREGRVMAKARARDTYKYYFKVGNKIVHGGITDDLERREEEHKQKWPNGHIVQVGRRTTEEAAMEWEEEKGFS
jgi:predicted GIY-YIG superfamily endonuclease